MNNTLTKLTKLQKMPLKKLKDLRDILELRLMSPKLKISSVKHEAIANDYVDALREIATRLNVKKETVTVYMWELKTENLGKAGVLKSQTG